MKIYRHIAAYLIILLLAFANMGAYLIGDAQLTPPSTHRHEQCQVVSASDAIPLYGLTEQRYSSGPGQSNGIPSFKHPFSWAAARTVFLNSPQVSGVGYFLLTKFLLIGFSTTDAIYPFHQFW